MTIALQAWVLVLTSIVSQAGDADEASSQLESFARQRDEIQTLQAKFTQQTITPDETIESTGTVVYINPKRIIFRYDELNLEYMIDAANAYEYDVELEQILIYDIAGRPEAEAFFMGFENNSEQLQEAYHVKVLPARDTAIHAFALELIPKSNDAEESLFERVVLQIRQGDFLPTEIDIMNDAESSVSFHVDDFVLNEMLPENQSSLYVPQDTTVIINDELADPIKEGGDYFPALVSQTSVLPEQSSLEPITNTTPLKPVDTTP